jgi:hypothetical protein
MLTILVVALGLMVWSAPMAHGKIHLTVNGQPLDSITLELGQSCTVEVVSTDGTSYIGYVGFDNGVALGTFSHLRTTKGAGDSATVHDYNQPPFSGYRVVADGVIRLPVPGIHFIFEYEAQQVGETDLKLYSNNPPPLAGKPLDSVHITVIPLVPEPMGTAITYQGRLMDANGPADGLYDFRFILYSKSWGIQEGNTIDINDVDVIEGQFVVELDFGSDPNIFNGYARWLQIGVRPSDSNDVHTMLSPRMELMPTPYSLYSKTAETAGYAQTAGGIPSGISGSGTDNYIAKFTGTNTLGDSAIYEEAGNVGIGTMNPLAGLHLKGTGHPSSFMYLQSDANEDTGFRLHEDADVKWHLFNDSALDGLSLRNNAYSPVLFAQQSTGNVGIGTTDPNQKLDVEGNAVFSGYVGIGTTIPGAKLDVESLGGTAVSGKNVESTDTGLIFEIPPTINDGPIWGVTDGYIGGATIGAYGRFSRTVPPGTMAYTNHAYLGGPYYALYARAGYGFAGYFSGQVYIRGKTTIRGNLHIKDSSTGATVIELGAGLDYAEGFDVSESTTIDAGSVLIIDSENPGKLSLSTKPYDSKVAGIVAGAKGIGSGVRLGTGEFDHDVALAGRVYCNVDTTQAGVEPGDLLTTSATPGYAMKSTDYARAQGAILGKAMESLEKGQKGQILVLVTLQ